MDHVHFSQEKAYELSTNYDESPTEYLESEGDRLIKEMVQKQTSTQVSLEEQLLESKTFEACTEFIPLTQFTSGQISFAEFKSLAEKVSHTEDLKSMGLTEKEIDLLHDFDKGEKYFEEKYRKVEFSALKANLEEVHKKINRKSKEMVNQQSGNEKSVSRHELELSLSIKPESDHTKLLQFALSCHSNGAAGKHPLTHPINSLKELESEMFSHLKPSSSKLKKKKMRIEKKSIHQEDVSKMATVEENWTESTSFWDKKSAPQSWERGKSKREGCRAKVHSCAPKRMFTVKDGRIVPLQEEREGAEPKSSLPSPVVAPHGNSFVLANAAGQCLDPSVQLVPLEEIQINKLKGDEMNSHPHFKYYSRGEPSKVLYIKNISPSVKEEDLVHLFGHFETPGEDRIAYRLMNGRMKGQAFVTFPSVDRASQALETINGYYCKGKHLVVQFGKSKK